MEGKTNKHILRKILLVIFIIFIIFFIFTLRKLIILNKIESLAKDRVNSINYYSEKIFITGKNTTIMKSYNKDGKYLTELRTFEPTVNEKRGTTIYKNNEDKLVIMESGETKIAFINSDTMIGEISVHTLGTEQLPLWHKLLVSATSRITSEECNNKKCYFIEPAKGWKLWIDKETGLIVREINGSTLQDSYYKFDEVKDEDIIKPDISDYKIVENN